MHAAVDTSCLWKANIIWVVYLQTAGAATATFLHDRASPRKINGWIFHQAVPLASLFLLNDTASRQHMLVHSVLANVLDSRAAAEGGCILILRINSTWHKWSAWVHGVRSACDQAGERQGFVLQSDIPGRFAFLPASLCFCFGEDVSSSFDLFLIVFSQLLGLCQVLYLPS